MYVYYCACDIIYFPLKDFEDVNTQCDIEDKEPQATTESIIIIILNNNDTNVMKLLTKKYSSITLSHQKVSFLVLLYNSLLFQQIIWMV